MSRPIKTFLSLTILSCFSTLQGCGVLWPEMAERPPVVVTKIEKVETPILLDATCPKPPAPPPKPKDHNTLSADASDYWNQFDIWAMTCADLNAALEAILRPSTETPKTEPKPNEGNP